MNAVMPSVGEQPVVGRDSEIAGKRLLVEAGDDVVRRVGEH